MKKISFAIALLVMVYGVCSAQSVGVGISTPLAKLEVAHTSTVSNPTLSLYDYNPGNFSRLQFQTTSGPKSWQIAGFLDNAVDANSKLNFYNSSYGDVLSLTGDGKVGIGMAPVTKLDVAGTARANGFQYSVARPFYYALSGPDFQPMISSQQLIVTDEKLISISGLNGAHTNGNGMVASLHLPHGATIAGFTAYFTDNSAENIEVQLIEYNPALNVNTIMGQVVSSGTPNNSFLTTNTISPNLVNNQGRAYKIFVKAASNAAMPQDALVIRSVNITYLLSEAQ